MLNDVKKAMIIYVVFFLKAILFAFWHLTGRVAIAIKADLSVGHVVGRLALSAASCLFFGMIYYFSNNIWLVVIAHGSTDYPFLPSVTDQPVIGLIFMSSLVFFAWLFNRKVKLKQMPEHALEEVDYK